MAGLVDGRAGGKPSGAGLSRKGRRADYRFVFSCFVEKAQEGWPGIRPAVLRGFERQLSADFQLTVHRFLELQALGAPDAQADVQLLKQAIAACPMPDVEILNGGLALLDNSDLRAELRDLTVPGLRLYGSQDGLVPRRVVPLVDELWPGSTSKTIAHAAHAPFVSHPEEFCREVMAFAGRVLGNKCEE